MFFPILFIIIGLAILVAGGEALVKGASSLAKRFGIAPIVIGLTIVAFGTSTPELVVNIFAAIRGTADIAIGNIIGSNIANILLILGVAGIITPLTVLRGTTWKEIPMALLAAILVLIMANDVIVDGKSLTELTRSDGLALIGFFIIFLYYTFGITKVINNNTNTKDSKEKSDEQEIKLFSRPISLALVFGGIVALFIGGKLLVDNAIILARLAGLSEALIGLTIVAVGTSLPELATSVIAAIHRQSELAIGNVVGSNIFNVFWILGFTSILRPLPFSPAMNFDLIVNIIATLLLFAFMFIDDKHRLNRWQGGTFVAMYAGYVLFAVVRG